MRPWIPHQIEISHTAYLKFIVAINFSLQLVAALALQKKKEAFSRKMKPKTGCWVQTRTKEYTGWIRAKYIFNTIILGSNRMVDLYFKSWQDCLVLRLTLSSILYKLGIYEDAYTFSCFCYIFGSRIPHPRFYSCVNPTSFVNTLEAKGKRKTTLYFEEHRSSPLANSPTRMDDPVELYPWILPSVIL